MIYCHRWMSGGDMVLAPGKVVCVGRNYAEHAKELGNPVPAEPLLFIKPATALTPLEEEIRLPQGRGAVHHEVEIALLIGEVLKDASEHEATEAIAGIGIALDLTLRDLQGELKRKGHPWEKAKAFDGSCPVSPFLPAQPINDLDGLGLRLAVNDGIRQQGSAGQMLVRIPALLSYISTCFTLMPGDLVLTGTPAGVGPLCSGDRLEVSLLSHIDVKTSVA